MPELALRDTSYGVAGAGAGWIIGETNPITQGLVQAGNYTAAAATAMGIAADAKSGSLRMMGSIVEIDGKKNLVYYGAMPSSTGLSMTTTSAGFAARVVELSILLQVVAIKRNGLFSNTPYGTGVIQIQ